MHEWYFQNLPLPRRIFHPLKLIWGRWSWTSVYWWRWFRGPVSLCSWGNKLTLRFRATGRLIITFQVWFSGQVGDHEATLHERLHQPNATWPMGQKVADFFVVPCPAHHFKVSVGLPDSLHLCCSLSWRTLFHTDSLKMSCYIPLRPAASQALNDVTISHWSVWE